MLFFIVPPFYDICKHISRFLPRQFLQRRINRPPFLTIADYSYITIGADTLVYAGQSLLCNHRNLQFLVIISNYSLTNGSLSHKIANIWKVNTVSDRTNHFLMSWGEGGEYTGWCMRLPDKITKRILIYCRKIGFFLKITVFTY